MKPILPVLFVAFLIGGCSEPVVETVDISQTVEKDRLDEKSTAKEDKELMKNLHALKDQGSEIIPVSESSLAPKKPFLDQSKDVVPQQEWNREIVSKNGVWIIIKIDSQAPVSVVLVAERSYKAILERNADGLHKSDFLLNIPNAPGDFGREVEIPSGSCWFIIQNLGKDKVSMRLRCYPK